MQKDVSRPNSALREMEYVGRIPELQGKIALVGDNSTLDETFLRYTNLKDRMVVARFADKDLVYNGDPIGRSWVPMMEDDFVPYSLKTKRVF